MDVYSRANAKTRRQLGYARVLPRGDNHDDHRSLVELRCRLRMYSRTADIAYRTARPILMNRGPVPFSRDLANQDDETPRSLATWAECSRGSISFVLAGELMAHLLSLLEMDRICPRGVRKNNARYRQIIQKGSRPVVSHPVDGSSPF